MDANLSNYLLSYKDYYRRFLINLRFLSNPLHFSLHLLLIFPKDSPKNVCSLFNQTLSLPPITTRSHAILSNINLYTLFCISTVSSSIHLHSPVPMKTTHFQPRSLARLLIGLFFLLSCNAQLGHDLKAYTQRDKRTSSTSKDILPRASKNPKSNSLFKLTLDQRDVIPYLSLGLSCLPVVMYYGLSSENMTKLSYHHPRDPGFSPIQLLTAPFSHTDFEHLYQCVIQFLLTSTLLEQLTDRVTIANATVFFLITTGLALLYRIPLGLTLNGLSNLSSTQEAFSTTIMFTELPMIQKCIQHYFPKSPAPQPVGNTRLLVYYLSTFSYLFKLLHSNNLQYLVTGTTPTLKSMALKGAYIKDFRGYQVATLVGILTGLATTITVNLPTKKTLKKHFFEAWEKTIGLFTCCKQKPAKD